MKKKNTGRATLKEVATLAKTSPISVSRAIKNPHLVSKKLQHRINKAINQIGYIPNQAARSLASSESKIISVIFPSLSNAVFSDILDGIHDTLSPAGFKILLANSKYSTQQESLLIETMLEQNPDGIIITGIDQTEQIKSLLKNTNTHTIQIMELCKSAAAAIDINIGFSHVDAGYEMTQHLFKKGYNKIGFIGARMDQRSQRRLQGYRKSMIEHKKNPDIYVFTSLKNTSFKLGGDMMSELLNKHNEIDAIFFSNDDLAAGAIFECQSRGIKIPEQIGIAGFNDLEFSSAIKPSLTTLAVPRYQIGTEAAKSLLNKLNNIKTKKKIDVGFDIIDRDSTK